MPAFPIAPEAYLAYLLASAVLVIVPGPSVTVIIANSLRHGQRAGLLNVAGTQAGLAIMLAVLAVGLQAIVAGMAGVFDWIRLIGAAYLIWLGVKLLRSDGTMGRAETARGSFFWQGFMVILSNPKALFFFGAFIPQFVDPEGDPLVQTLVLGLTFMVVATVFDGAYALLAGGAGRWLTRRRVRVLEVASGCCLIGGGVWLALTRRAA